MKRKSSPRLKSFSYKGSHVYSLTICTYKRRRRFKSPSLVSAVIKRLDESAGKYGFSVIAYTFMLDHIHMLVRGSDDSNLKAFVKHFKQTSGYDFKRKNNENLWHISYYDHVLRKDEDIHNVARYILENPVREGLVKDFRDYSFSGSFEFDIKDMLWCIACRNRPSGLLFNTAEAVFLR